MLLKHRLFKDINVKIYNYFEDFNGHRPINIYVCMKSRQVVNRCNRTKCNNNLERWNNNKGADRRGVITVFCAAFFVTVLNAF